MKTTGRRNCRELQNWVCHVPAVRASPRPSPPPPPRGLQVAPGRGGEGPPGAFLFLEVQLPLLSDAVMLFTHFKREKKLFPHWRDLRATLLTHLTPDVLTR